MSSHLTILAYGARYGPGAWFGGYRYAAAPVRMPILLAGAAVYGLVLAVLGGRIAARVAAGKLPELVQFASRSVV